jgi:hypothetical protein
VEIQPPQFHMSFVLCSHVMLSSSNKSSNLVKKSNFYEPTAKSSTHNDVRLAMLAKASMGRLELESPQFINTRRFTFKPTKASVSIVSNLLSVNILRKKKFIFDS